MDKARILALSDVRIVGASEHADQLRSFYTDVVGLSAEREEGDMIVLRGEASVGPRLILDLAPAAEDVAAPAETSRSRSLRRRVLIQVRSLSELAETLRERQIRFVELQGLFRHDQRLVARDPGGNRVELLTRHACLF